MNTVVDCLLTLRTQFMSSGGNFPTAKPGSIRGDASPYGPFTPLSAEERRKVVADLKFQRALHTPLMSLLKHVYVPPCACLLMFFFPFLGQTCLLMLMLHL